MLLLWRLFIQHHRRYLADYLEFTLILFNSPYLSYLIYILDVSTHQQIVLSAYLDLFLLLAVAVTMQDLLFSL